MRRALPHLAAVAGFTLLALALLAPALRGRAAVVRQNLLAFDPLYRTDADAPGPVYADNTMVAADVPRDTAVARGLRRGRLPAWNPLSACGAPLWAEQGGPFNPLKAPFYLAPSGRGYALYLCLRLIVAACGAYALARYRGLPWLAGVAAGASFELSGMMVSQLQFGSASATSMLPWALLGAAALVRTGSRRAVAGAAVALGLAASGGHPTVSALVFVAFTVALAGHAVTRLRRPHATAALAANGGVAVLLAIALAAPTLLPLAELTAHATSYKDREMGPEVWTIELGKTRATAPIAIVAPEVLRRMYASAGPEHESAGAFGGTAVVLAGAGVLVGGLDAGLIAVGLMGIALTFMPPGFSWVHGLPGLRFILPEYAWPLIALPVTQAVGAGLEALPSAAGLRAIVWSLLGFALGLVVLVAFGPPSLPSTLWGPFPSSLPQRFAQVLAEDGGRIGLLLPVALTAVAIAGGALLRRRAPRSRVAHAAMQLAFLGLVVAELLWLAMPRLRNPLVGTDPTAPPPAVEFLQARLADPRWRMSAMPLVGQPLTPMLFGLPDERGLAALPIDRYRHYLQLIDPYANGIAFQQAMPKPSPLHDLAAVRYVGAWRLPNHELAAQLDGDADMPLISATPYVGIYENLAALPRVRIVHRSEPVADAESALARLTVLSGGAAHARDSALLTTAIIEPDAAGAPPPALSGTASDTEWVRITDASDPDALALEARIESPALVVVADTYYPGWKAWLDDAPVSIYPANEMFRAVYVPAGQHTVRMRYEPASLRIGGIVFAFSAMVCLLLAVPKRAATDDRTADRP